MKRKKTKAKPFDCVAFKRIAQGKIYQKIKNLTPEQEIAFFETEAERGPLGDWWRKIKSAQSRVHSRRRTV